MTITPVSVGIDWACAVPRLTEAAGVRVAWTRSLLDTRVLESTTGIEPRGTLEQPCSMASAVKAGNHHLFTSHPLKHQVARPDGRPRIQFIQPLTQSMTESSASG
jgi:hypothetical protein